MSTKRIARSIQLAAILGLAIAACSKAGADAAGSGGKTGLAGGAGGTGLGGTTAKVSGSGGSGSGGSVVSTSTASGGVQASGGSRESGGAPGSGGATGGMGAGATGRRESGTGGVALSSGGSPAGGADGGGATSSPRDGGVSVQGTGGAGGSRDAGKSDTGGSVGTTCSTSTLKAGDTTRNLTIGGTKRSYILHVPSGYTGTKPVPLVLDFHALGGTGSQEQSGSGYQAIADKEGFLIAFPNGIDNAWNIGPCCTNSRDVDDLGFAKGMVADVTGAGCVDLKRVYSTGISMGGGMSHYLACNAADVFAAVAPAAFDLLVPDEEPCAPSRPISVLAFRGTADTVVPYAGGKGSSGRVTFMGAQACFSRWAQIDDCVEPTSTDGDCTYYKQCGNGVEVGLCVKQGGGHAGGDANAGWAFLSRFSLP